jgi:hypothetical protein
MKKGIITTAGMLIIISVASGCESPPPIRPSTTSAIQTYGNEQVCGYPPARIKITPLTELAVNESEETLKLQLYVDVLDEFDSRIKAPLIFRFELYEYVPRSSEEKGKRNIIWPDINLTEPERNNEYWRDFLRCYRFTLDVGEEIEENHSYVLQTTCITPAGERLTADHIVEY